VPVDDKNRLVNMTDDWPIRPDWRWRRPSRARFPYGRQSFPDDVWTGVRPV